ncbi:MAG: hypothetical protein IKL89_04090 [Clostridia bacterium]|nr:hypothetical protein [Clostridia bacterium]
MCAVRLKIGKQSFFNNADLLLPAIKDSQGNPIEDGVRAWLEQDYELAIVQHNEVSGTRDGYDAKQLNKLLRKKMYSIGGIHGEVYVEHGAFLTKANKGFDFALFDEEYNIVKLRNAFVGNPGHFEGETPLLGLYAKVLNADDSKYTKRRDWKAKLDSLCGTNGTNILYQKQRYTVVGELQFGNWALGGHDLLRLLNSSIDGEIDYYVYVTATGDLQKGLSSNTVNFDKIIGLFKENRQLLRTPTWVIGLDVKTV